MNNDYVDHSFARRREWYSDTYADGPGTGWHGGPGDAVHLGVPLTPLDPGWDPAEELAYLLQEAVPAEPAAMVPPPRSETPSDNVGFTDPVENLAQITAQLPPIRRSSAGHRKMPVRTVRLGWLRTGSFVIVALVAAIVAMVSVFGGIVAYRPLQNITSGTGAGMAHSWPLLVYGPWMVASLSILRTALHQRRAVHSWFIVLLFSSVAMMLCVAQADRTFTGIAGAALPALASLACFQQLVRQITLTLPPRQGTPRHRQ
ncbi:DUF2637 domain-containing protein [Streptomyces sp. ALI-76-A]|jgi:hypothetical protein|uniref:DUF2637 domain-containing protein n=1 Tax=Streptomyces sp. ALI-76-A TaxID=3025736 RepID=UPI00256F3019|nr:DUF2637 domain-containing protein [Streptomyces sp. ALI-76-A]MDL5205974.1 DUF2637 domain-containing protein [Streptomyces sp. ALI-76-A]